MIASDDDGPWLAHYDAGVPATLAPYPNRTLVDYLDDSARERPQQAALLYKGATITYGELDRLSDALASAFRDLGVRRGDRVALLLPNCPQFFIAQFAAWKIGAIVAPLNPIYTEQELEGAAPRQRHRNHRHADALLRPREARAAAHAAHARHRHQHQGILSAAAAPALHAGAGEARWRSHRRSSRGDHDLARLLREHRGRTVERAAITADDHAVLLMSGGTTGTPKGVLGTHGAYVMAGLQEAAWMSSVLRPDTDVILLPLPLFHVYGHVGVQSLALINHSPLAIVPNPRDIPDLIQHDPPRQAGVLQRRADAVHRAAEPSRRAAGQGRLQVDQALHVGRRAADGRNEAPVRIDHRRPDRRRLFVDRSDDGAVHQPGERAEQARLGRHAAARRPRPHLRRRRRHARDAGRRSRRDRRSRRRS